MKEDYDITKQMQDDLIAAYNKVSPTSWSLQTAYARAVKQPAPRYYITAKQALQILSPMVRGDFRKVDNMLPNKRRMYYSLLEKVTELSEKRAFRGKSLYYILRYAVTSPAPEFFIGISSLYKMRRLMKMGLIDDEGRTAPIESKIRAYEKLKAKREKRKEWLKNHPSPTAI